MRSTCFEKKAARHQLVHELRAQGLSYREIQEKTGFSQVSIWKYLSTTEPIVSPRRALSLERLEIAKQMKANGATYREIGERFGMTASSALELIRSGPGEAFSGVCVVCGVKSDELVRHHTDYLKDEGEPVCRKCHIKTFHPDALNHAKAARADKRVEDKMAILKVSGWTELQVSIRDNGRRHITGRPPGGAKPIDAPNPLKDLNALHAAIMALDPDKRFEFNEALRDSVRTDWDEVMMKADIDRWVNATAEQKAAVLLQIIREPLTTAATPAIVTP